jgi:hypothetical protein
MASRHLPSAMPRRAGYARIAVFRAWKTPRHAVPPANSSSRIIRAWKLPCMGARGTQRARMSFISAHSGKCCAHR